MSEPSLCEANVNLIRSVTINDHDTVRRITVESFASCEFGHNGEADLIETLRNGCDDLLELVALHDDIIVGHVLFSPVQIGLGSDRRDGMGLAPMSVAPGHQRTGIGIALVESGIAQLAAIKCPFIVVLGHPEYYPRFGFQPASRFDLSHGFGGIPQDVFFVNVLDHNVTESISNNTAFYRPEFGPQQEECAEPHDGPDR